MTNDVCAIGESGSDSTAGKLMEKAGNVLHSSGLENKGREKRDEAGQGYGGGSNY